MMQVLYVIDFEGNYAKGIKEYGVVELINMQITQVYSADNIEDFNKYTERFVFLRKKGSFVGHNITVEDHLLRKYIASPGFVKRTSESCENVNTWSPWIDTKVLYKNFFPAIADFSLSHLINVFELFPNLITLADKYCKISHIGYHNALFDALATSMLLQNLVNILSKNNVIPSLDTLIEYSQKSNMV